jgi:hypothetical protein
MTKVLEVTAKSVKIKSPTKLSDLETILWKEDPVLQTMKGMQVLINGVAASGDPELKNKD